MNLPTRNIKNLLENSKRKRNNDFVAAERRKQIYDQVINVKSTSLPWQAEIKRNPV